MAGGWVSLELDDESKLDAPPIMAPGGKSITPEYPYGLKICLCNEQIEKLDLEDEVDAGEYLVFKARACVTSVSSNKMADGSKERRVELQIEDMKILGVEDEPEEADEKPAKPSRKRGLEYDKDALPKSGY